MSVTNFGELKAFVLDMASRTGDASLSPADYVRMAESMIAREVRAIEMVTSYTLDDDDRDSGGVYDLPANFLGARAVFGTYAGRAYEVKPVSLVDLRRYEATARALRYATYGLKLEFRGVPATGAEFELIYFARPAAFSDEADTNTLLTNHPDLYTSATLHWLHLKAQDVELAQGYASEFSAIRDTLNELASTTRSPGAPAPAFNLGNFSIGSGY